MISKIKINQRSLTISLFCLAIYFPLFLHLDKTPLKTWDESLYAMRAAYLVEEGKHLHIFSDFVKGGPAHLNAKPPFTTWIQAVSFKIFGYNLLALRLPIVLMALGTIFLSIFLSKKLWNQIGQGLFAGLVLVSSGGFISTHVTRTGDQDAALTMYLFLAVLAFYQFIKIENSKRKNIYLALSIAMLVAAFLTKSIVALFVLPGFLVFAIYKKKMASILKSKASYLSILAFILPVALYYGLREWNHPGYLDWFINRDLLHRYSSGIDGNVHPFGFYFKNIWNGSFFPWVLFLPFSWLLISQEKFKQYKDIVILFSATAICFLLIISISKTKFFWYDAPVYPLLATLVGISLFEILKTLKTQFQSQFIQQILSLFFIFALFFIPYQKVIEKVYFPDQSNVKEQFGGFIEHLEDVEPGLKNYTIAYIGFNGHVCYYAGIFNRTKGYQIKLSNSSTGKKSGELVMLCESRINDPLQSKYELEVLKKYKDCKLVKIKQEK